MVFPGPAAAPRRARSAELAVSTPATTVPANGFCARKNTPDQPALSARFAPSAAQYSSASPSSPFSVSSAMVVVDASVMIPYSVVHTIGNAAAGGCHGGFASPRYHRESGSVSSEPATAVATTAAPTRRNVRRHSCGSISTTAARIAASYPFSPPGGRPRSRCASSSWHTASWMRLPTSGRATPDSTGVTNPTQWEASSGVNTGTVRMNRPPSPVTSAYRRIMSA